MEAISSVEGLMILWGLIPVLYAETHYSFKGIYSRLKKRQPEIIADVPHRLDPGCKLPVLLVVKDADRFPVTLHSVEIDVRVPSKAFTFRMEFGDMNIADSMWHDVIDVAPGQHLRGSGEVDVRIEYTVRGSRRTARNDNHNGTSHLPFQVHFAAEPLPKQLGWYFGEFHCHTNYTSDQVEFGAPLPAIARMGLALGLTFACATDHSYDLDDDPNDYLKQDKDLRKWQAFRQEVRELNTEQNQFVIVPGEEVSAGNCRDRNVHFLILNDPQFIPGAGDGAEKWFRNTPDLAIEQVLDLLSEGTLAYAAHPAVRPPFLEWLLIRRGQWHTEDVIHERLNGLQIWNGTDGGFDEGKLLWIKTLLSGQKLHIAAGNDAHGNFGRFRQIGFPFFSMRESHDHLFGKVKTGLWLGARTPTLAAILDAIAKGRMIVTDGPFCCLEIGTAKHGKTAAIGGTVQSGLLRLRAMALSTAEFGRLSRLQIFRGTVGAREEVLLFEGRYEVHSVQEDFLADTGGLSYVRAELYTETGRRCLTNPIWIGEGSGPMA